MNPDQLAELEDERKFLLRSLVDLEREHAAGDVDDVDYHELKEGYTVRAAATLRAIDEGRSSLPAKPAPNWTRRGLVAGGLVVAVLVVWWALATWSAERTPGQQLSGLDPRSQQQQLMAQARAIQFESPGEASELYGQVLADDPDNVEALTYRGWTLALDAVQRGGGTDASVVPQLQDALDSLLQATDLDPTYPDPKCLLGIVNFRMLRQAEAAQPWVEACLAANPPADIRELVEALSTDIESELAQPPATAAP
jgi:tetratricopeptide (TPR) repeat protein